MPAVISDAAFSYSEGTYMEDISYIISPAYVFCNAVIGLIWVR